MTLKCDVFPVPRENPVFENNDIIVVIDVLRATTTMVTAFEHGCKQILPVMQVQNAFDRAAELQKTGSVVIGGERKGKRVEGFDFGNSPLEYSSDSLQDKTIIMTTTNGTRALVLNRQAPHVLIACLRNIRAVLLKIVELKGNVTIVCAGTDGHETLEDSVCAGLIAKELAEHFSFQLTPDADKVKLLAEQNQHDLLAMLLKSPHGAYLKSIGFLDDLKFCSKRDVSEMVPMFKNDCIMI